MNLRNRLQAIESIVRRLPRRCTHCGRGRGLEPELIVLYPGDALGMCSSCGGHLSPAGEPVGTVNERVPAVTVILLRPDCSRVPEPPFE